MATNGRSTPKSGTTTKTSAPGGTSKRRLTRSRTAGTQRTGATPARSDTPVVEPAKSDAPVVEVAVDDPVLGPASPQKALAASETDLAKLQAARRARVIKAAVLTAIALIFITFVLQNAGAVGVRLLAWTVSIRLIWVIVASAVLGALGGYVVGRPDKRLLLHGPNRRDEDPL